MKKPQSSLLLYLVIISLLNLILTYMVKYDLNPSSISSINISYFGNIITIILEIILILFLFAQMLNYQTLLFRNKISLVVMTSLIFLLLLSSYLILKLGISFPDEYLFGYPLKKVIVGGSLFLSLTIKIYIIALLYYLFMNKGFDAYLRAISATILILVITVGSIFVYTFKNGHDVDKLKPSNSRIGVVLGAAVWSNDKPSPIFKGRIEKANELLKNKRIFKIQLTGSNAPGEKSEANTAYNYGLNLGIKKHLMLVEENTTTTTEQILFIKNEFPRSSGISVLIISDQFHLTRVLEICKFFNVKAVAVASDYDLDWKKLLYYRFRESVALLLFWLFAI
ncbi:MAG: YdcF family protein [Melioribacteraceae bacterium]|nr:YdcF family protein [Melioribacteraceae bacterium]